MRFHFILLTAILISSSSGFSQTKLIAHKSHSGKASTFALALRTNYPDIASSNFGMAPRMEVKFAVLDTLKIISDTGAVMVTSQYCLTSPRKESEYWEAGVDTVYNHSLFTKEIPIDSIKVILTNQYNFRNSMDSVVFIGWEADTTVKEKKNQTAPVFNKDNDTTPPSHGRGLVIVMILIVSVLVGIVGKMHHRSITVSGER